MALVAFSRVLLNVSKSFNPSTNYCLNAARISITSRNGQTTNQSVVYAKTDGLDHARLVDVPAAPKRPLLPYFIFMQEKLPQLRKTLQGTKQTELVKTLAEEWKKLTLQEKEKYTERYNKEKAKYKAEKENWQNNLNQEQLFAIQEEKKAVKEKKEKRKQKKEKKIHEIELRSKLGKPKRPPNSFYYFSSDRMKKEPGTSFKDELSKAAQLWKSLTEEEKKPYVEKAEVEMIKYKKEMLKWKEKIDLIGSGSKKTVSKKVVAKKVSSPVKDARRKTKTEESDRKSPKRTSSKKKEDASSDSD